MNRPASTAPHAGAATKTTAFPAAAAREAAGFTLAAAAKRAGISAKYLRECERRGQFSWHRANVLARLYDCSLNLFLPATRARGTPRSRARRPNRARDRAGGNPARTGDRQASAG